MSGDRESLRPVVGANRALREQLTLKDELILALIPTLVVLGVLAFVEALSRQRLLFASLASSAFLIYLDPRHNTNAARTLSVAHLLAAGLGFVAYLSLGPGCISGGVAMVATIVLMILLDMVHPPLEQAERGEQSVGAVCREHGIAEATFYRWRRAYGGMSVNETQRLKELEKENARLKRLLAERMLEVDAMKELLAKKA